MTHLGFYKFWMLAADWKKSFIVSSCRNVCVCVFPHPSWILPRLRFSSQTPASAEPAEEPREKEEEEEEESKNEDFRQREQSGTQKQWSMMANTQWITLWLHVSASTHSRLCLLLLLGDVCGGALPLQFQLSEKHRHIQSDINNHPLGFTEEALCSVKKCESNPDSINNMYFLQCEFYFSWCTRGFTIKLLLINTNRDVKMFCWSKVKCCLSATLKREVIRCTDSSFCAWVYGIMMSLWMAM